MVASFFFLLHNKANQDVKSGQKRREYFASCLLNVAKRENAGQCKKWLHRFFLLHNKTDQEVAK